VAFTKIKERKLWYHVSLKVKYVIVKIHSLNPVYLGPYDFRDAENVDGIAESSRKNGIYYIRRNVTEFVKFLMNELKTGQYT